MRALRAPAILRPHPEGPRPVIRIASWNVNSIKVRLGHLLDWAKETNPDVVLLQEIKCEDHKFPSLEIEDAGYNVAVHGQKTYNGVAILSKRPIEDVMRGLPGDDSDEQARYLEATVSSVRIASIYLPNGNPVDSEKFPYKLGWMRRLRDRVRDLLDNEETFVLGGDYNICPTDDDTYDPEGFAGDALCRPESRGLYREILYMGVTEAWRALHPREIAYSYWDFRRGAWQKNDGLRIDHLLLSPQGADRLQDAGIDRTLRGRPKASDHVPVWCALSEE